MLGAWCCTIHSSLTMRRVAFRVDCIRVTYHGWQFVIANQVNSLSPLTVYVWRAQRPVCDCQSSKCTSFDEWQHMTYLFRTLSSWGSSNCRPSAPFLYEVASHVKRKLPFRPLLPHPFCQWPPDECCSFFMVDGCLWLSIRRPHQIYILHGNIEGNRRRCSQKERRIDNIVEWTGKSLAETRAMAHNRQEWRDVMKKSYMTRLHDSSWKQGTKPRRCNTRQYASGRTEQSRRKIT